MTTTQPACVECGAPAAPDPRGTALFRKFCSNECMKRHNNRRARRRRPPLAVSVTKVCAQCGTQFVARKRDRIYCYNGWCAVRAYKERTAKIDGPREFTCDGCGSTFTATKANARWCSKQCANRYWGSVRARQRPLPSLADYTDLMIFDRDGWKCHLCGKRIDRTLPRTHPMGATIDHLVPLARGGTDTAANVAAAHWSCNHDRGMNGEVQLRLS